MKTSSQPQVDASSAKKGRSVLRRQLATALNTLASVKFAVAVIVVIAAACVVGTILPQGTEVAAFLRKDPAAAGRMALFGKLGLTHVFSAWWFLALLSVLAATVMVCSTRRLATVRRATGFARRRALGSMLTHISILLILAGAVVRGVWGQKGYIALRQGQTTRQFEEDKGLKSLPFALQLARFQIETYHNSTVAQAAPKLLVQWPARQLQATVPANVGAVETLTPQGETPSLNNTFRVEVLRQVQDFAINMATHEVTSRSDEPKNPALLVAVNGPDYHNHRWVFARFPNFTMHEDGSMGRPSPVRLIYQDSGVAAAAMAEPIKSFKSTLNVVQKDGKTVQRTVEVNHPLKFDGYTFYQTGYDPNDLSWTSLQVVRDPGVPLVYSGFALIIVGLFIVFYLNPWLTKREQKA